MLTLPVHRIIPFSNVEGIGNRTSIFVQGCNANCLYCHNSETIAMKAEGVRNYTVQELLDLIKGNMPFIRGITVSGGEATLYPEFLAVLFREVHELGITCYVDTNGFFNRQKIQSLITETDKFLYDVKGIGEGLKRLCFTDLLLNNDHRVQGYQQRFVEAEEHILNLEHLLTEGKIEEVRLVHIKGLYDEKAVINRIAESLSAYSEIPLKLIRMHVRGLPKERLQFLKGAVPKVSEFNALAKYAKSIGIANVVSIG